MGARKSVFSLCYLHTPEARKLVRSEFDTGVVGGERTSEKLNETEARARALVQLRAVREALCIDRAAISRGIRSMGGITPGVKQAVRCTSQANARWLEI